MPCWLKGDYFNFQFSREMSRTSLCLRDLLRLFGFPPIPCLICPQRNYQVAFKFEFRQNWLVELPFGDNSMHLDRKRAGGEGRFHKERHWLRFFFLCFTFLLFDAHARCLIVSCLSQLSCAGIVCLYLSLHWGNSLYYFSARDLCFHHLEMQTMFPDAPTILVHRQFSSCFCTFQLSQEQSFSNFWHGLHKEVFSVLHLEAYLFKPTNIHRGGSSLNLLLMKGVIFIDSPFLLQIPICLSCCSTVHCPSGSNIFQRPEGCSVCMCVCMCTCKGKRKEYSVPRTAVPFLNAKFGWDLTRWFLPNTGIEQWAPSLLPSHFPSSEILQMEPFFLGNDDASKFSQAAQGPCRQHQRIPGHFYYFSRDDCPCFGK